MTCAPLISGGTITAVTVSEYQRAARQQVARPMRLPLREHPAGKPAVAREHLLQPSRTACRAKLRSPVKQRSAGVYGK